jgi:hypothetical protein
MGWLSLVLQLLSLRKSMQESQSMIEHARHFAERGKRTLLSIVAYALAGLFFFSGLLVAVIDMGLKLEKSGQVAYSGLMISATVLVAIGLLSVGGGILLGRSKAPEEPVHEPSARADRIKDLLEDFLVGFLTNLSLPKAEGKRKKSEERPKQD